MAKIFLLGTHKQPSGLERSLLDRLSSEHDILLFHLQIGGYDWETAVQNSIKMTDVTIVLITSTYSVKHTFRDEISYLISYINEFKTKIFIPILIGKVEIPAEIDRFGYLPLHLNDPDGVEHIIKDINQVISTHEGKVAAKEIILSQQNEQFNAKANEYVDLALDELKLREAIFSKSAKRWYMTGYFAIALGTIVALGIAYANRSVAELDKLKWETVVFLGIKSLIVIALLLAMAKYSFMLAKSFMDEALKNSDRIHAILFGRFFLQAFGKQADSSNVKEVFQHWNITSKNSFSNMQTETIEPKILDIALDLAKIIVEKKKTP